MGRFRKSMADADQYLWMKFLELIELISIGIVTNILTVLGICVILISVIVYPILRLFIWPKEKEEKEDTQ